MYYKSKKVSLLILFLTAVICSGLTIFLFGDPTEKTFSTALILGLLVYFISLAFYLFDASKNPSDVIDQYDSTGISILQHLSLTSFVGFKRVLLAIVVQIVLAVGFSYI